MDLAEAIRLLRAELKQLEATIAAFEKLDASVPVARPLSRRGRKSMGAAERQQVAERMKRYWAARRAQQVEPKPALLQAARSSTSET